MSHSCFVRAFRAVGDWINFQSLFILFIFFDFSYVIRVWNSVLLNSFFSIDELWFGCAEIQILKVNYYCSITLLANAVRKQLCIRTVFVSSFLAVLVADLEVKSPVRSITREYLGANLGANLDRSVNKLKITSCLKTGIFGHCLSTWHLI